MEYPKGRSESLDKPADGRGLNEAVAAERNPEIARFLEQQKKLIDALWALVTTTDNMLSPVMRPKEPKGTEEERARVGALTGIGEILDQNNRSLDGMIGYLSALHKRLEI